MHDTIAPAAQKIRNGEVIAFPTETVYGLGANALDAKAVAKIYALKGRPADNPCIVHVSDERMLALLTTKISPTAKKLMAKFWPGPLTLLFPKSDVVPDAVTAGLKTVAVRIPNHPMALSLIQAANLPIAAPSANRSGRPSPTSAEHVREDFPDVFVLDGGECEHGLESTVVDLTGKPRVLRQGAITLEQLKKVVPTITVAKHTSKKPSSPGMKYKHYAPAKPLLLFTSVPKMVAYAKTHPGAVAICLDKHLAKFKHAIPVGANPQEMGRNLYRALRTRLGDEILVHAVPKTGYGRTVMERLEKAATKIS